MRSRFAVLLALAAIPITSCGGDDDGTLSAEEYDLEAEAALQSIAQLEELSAPLADPKSVDQYVEGVRAIAAEIDATVADLESLDPPEELAGAHDDLIAVVADFGAVFPPVADAAEAGDDAALQASAERLQAAEAEFSQAIGEVDAQFQAEGVDLGPLG